MKAQKMTNEIKATPRFPELVCAHSVMSVFLAYIAAYVSGLIGMGFSNLGSGTIWYYGGVIMLIIAPLFNGTVYCRKMVLKRKQMLYRLIAITYGTIAFCEIALVLPEIRDSVGLFVEFTNESIHIPISYIGNSIVIMWIEFKHSTWERDFE